MNTPDMNSASDFATHPSFESVCETARQAMLFHSAADALEWDERTGMPTAGGAYRAKQVSLLRSSAHRLRTGADYGDSLNELAGKIADVDIDPHDDVAATVRELHRDFQRDRKLPLELVSRVSLATVRGQQQWDSARKNDSFAEFRDALSEIVSLKQETGSRMAEDSEKSSYEALVDEYEPDASVKHLNGVFGDLKIRLTNLIGRIGNASRKPNVELLRQTFDLDKQRSFSRQVAQAVGFDFSRGRLDETSHPFCTTLGPNDCRILSRYESNWFPSGLYGTLHEAGHGMYEQGMRREWFGLPPGSYVSLGMHESQSRLWENQVGRSRSFWKWLQPHAEAAFPDQFAGRSLDEIYFAINQVSPSLIRVEADEATYNLHILIRFELEQALIDGRLSVDDLPDAWNHEYETCLGIKPPSDADGVLQDVHWSAGLFGYFPTYTLGTMAAAQLFASAVEAMGGAEAAEAQFAQGEFLELRRWLRERVHKMGSLLTPGDLIAQATGRPLAADDLMAHIADTIAAVYGDDLA
ncbi:MAG: carboxypeptidase M32 [Acidobacteriota bacterium]